MNQDGSEQPKRSSARRYYPHSSRHLTLIGAVTPKVLIRAVRRGAVPITALAILLLVSQGTMAVASTGKGKTASPLGPHVTGVPNRSAASSTPRGNGGSGPLIVANNAAFGGGPIQTYDFGTGALVNFFVPDGATGSNNGRAVAVVGNEVFYTELSGDGFGPSDSIHVAPFNGGAGGNDTRTLPNPAPSVGIQDLDYANGALYALTGYYTGSLQVWKLDPATGAVLGGPIAINSDPSSDGFTVLPNGNFLINSTDESCSYSEYDSTTGAPTGFSLSVPGAAQCTGVATDGSSLYFQTDFDAFTKTDLTGNLISQTTVASNLAEDISLVGGAGPVLGLGDSIAAGYGLGPAEGYPDNNGAYPYLLAQSLGEPAKDYAVEGACASSTEPHCKQHSMDWQIGKVPSTFTPGLVTVTVGADDIHFGDCLKAIIKEYDLYLQSPKDPCNPTTLAANLGALQQSLTTDLQTLSAKYPNAAIRVMNYYNPFPAPPSESDSPCFLDQVLTLFYAHSQGNGWPSVAAAYFLHHKEFLDEARSIQGLVYDEAQTVIGQLNDTIDTAATGLARVIDTSDFAGHDMCAHTSQWVFSPTLKIHLSFLGFHWNRSLGGEDCPDATAVNLLAEKKDISFVGGNLKLAASANCTPHPTQDGQAAIANDFFQQG